MSRHAAAISWARHGAAFVDNRYSRVHQWAFDGGAVVVAAASPSIVPPSCTSVEAVDPEEAFVASLASCHMLWFLSIAAGRGLVVENYDDAADGVLADRGDGTLAITDVTLRPRVTFVGSVPSAADYEALHQEAHARCFIANSVTTRVHCAPEPPELVPGIRA